MDRNNAQHTWTGTGTGNPTLGSASSGYRSFSGLTGYFAYKIDNGGAEWEIGVGSVDGSYPLMTRSTVLANHLGTTALVNFTAGTKTVSLVQVAERSVVVGSTTPGTPPQAIGAESIVGGSGSKASGSYGVALGQNTDAGNASDVIAIGHGHTVSGSTPHVIALGENASVNIGAPGYCISVHSGQVNHPHSKAHGPYAITRGWGTKSWTPWAGDTAHAPYSQIIDVAWGCFTTDATPKVLRLAPSTNQDFFVNQKTLVVFDIMLAALELGGSYRTYAKRITGAQRFDAFEGTPVHTDITGTGFGVSASIAATSQLLRITATGLAATNIQWSAHGRLLEINSAT